MMDDPWLVGLAVGSALFVSGLVWWRSITLKRRSNPKTARHRRLRPSRQKPSFVSPVPVAEQPTEVLRQVVILFGAESVWLSQAATAALAEAAKRLTDQPALTVTVEGSADSSGNPSRNLVLARDRAWAARQFLLDRGIAPDRIRSVVHPPRAGGTEYERRRLRSVRLTWEA
jgi:outer membrane protein OmpA-like peptidoglycan-associated protein